jgi:hypothetical protein
MRHDRAVKDVLTGWSAQRIERRAARERLRPRLVILAGINDVS